MHEFNLLRNLIKKINEISAQNDNAKVVRVGIWLGALSHITPEHFAEHFAEETKGTVAEGAKLDVVQDEDERHENAQDILLKEIEIENKTIETTTAA